MSDTDNSFFTSETPQLLDFTPPPPTIAIMGADNTPLVTIHPDGTLDYGPGYTPDEAAHRFWEALRRLAPARCEHCGHLPGSAAP